MKVVGWPQIRWGGLQAAGGQEVHFHLHKRPGVDEEDLHLFVPILKAPFDKIYLFFIPSAILFLFCVWLHKYKLSQALSFAHSIRICSIFFHHFSADVLKVLFGVRWTVSF